MSGVLVSIIIPTFNREKTIINAIDSIIAQNISSLEIIVVDDKSTDNTHNIINQLVRKYSFLKYIVNNGCKGPSCARNVGIDSSVGKYIAFLDSDDVWLEDHLAPAVEILEDNHGDCVVFGDALNKHLETGQSSDHFDDMHFLKNINMSQINRDFYLITEPIFSSLIQESFLLLPSMIAESKIIKSLMLNENVIYSEDRDLGIRLEKEREVRFIIRKQPTYIRYWSDNNLCTPNNTNTIKMFLDHVELFVSYSNKYKLSDMENRVLNIELLSRYSKLSDFYRYEKQYRNSMVYALKMLSIDKKLKTIISVLLLVAKLSQKYLKEVFYTKYNIDNRN